MASNAEVYESVTRRILSDLEHGVIPWRKPWHEGGATLFPRNMLSCRSYSGINVWLLHGRFSSPFWGTFECAKRCGGHVNKGERGTRIILWKIYERDARPTDTNAHETVDGRRIVTVYLLREFVVFNVEQMELPAEFLATLEAPAGNVPPIEAAEQMVAHMPKRPAITFRHDAAAYFPRRDVVEMPVREQFERSEEFYSTLLHELVHATGHKSRLDREGVSDNGSPFGGDTYGREELIAEMGAAFLCGICGIEQKTLANSSAYIRNWMNAIRGDTRLLVTAASAAQKAADYILGATAMTAERDDARTAAEIQQAA